MKAIGQRRLDNILKDYNEMMQSSEYDEDLIQDAVLAALENGKISVRKGLNLVLEKEKENQSKKDKYSYEECSFLELKDFQYSIYFDWLTVQDDIRHVINNALTKKERQILDYRFYQEMSLKDIGKIFGVGYEKIRQIEDRALRKMRYSSNSKYLRGYLFDDIILKKPNLEVSNNEKMYLKINRTSQEPDTKPSKLNDIDIREYIKTRKENLLEININCFLNNEDFKISRIPGDLRSPETIMIYYIGEGDIGVYLYEDKYLLATGDLSDFTKTRIYYISSSNIGIEVDNRRIQYDLYLTDPIVQSERIRAGIDYRDCPEFHISIEYYNFYRNKDKKIGIKNWIDIPSFVQTQKFHISHIIKELLCKYIVNRQYVNILMNRRYEKMYQLIVSKLENLGIPIHDDYVLYNTNEKEVISRYLEIIYTIGAEINWEEIIKAILPLREKDIIDLASLIADDVCIESDIMDIFDSIIRFEDIADIDFASISPSYYNKMQGSSFPIIITLTFSLRMRHLSRKVISDLIFKTPKKLFDNILFEHCPIATIDNSVLIGYEFGYTDDIVHVSYLIK